MQLEPGLMLYSWDWNIDQILHLTQQHIFPAASDSWRTNLHHYSCSQFTHRRAQITFTARASAEIACLDKMHLLNDQNIMFPTTLLCSHPGIGDKTLARNHVKKRSVLSQCQQTGFIFQITKIQESGIKESSVSTRVLLRHTCTYQHCLNWD